MDKKIPVKKIVPQPPVAQEIWDGRNEGWTLVTYKRKKKKV
jgi:hypothetical protein